jgi:CRP-like cAMP-binding protein
MSADGDVVAGYIMKEGERGNEMWIVVDGSVRVERESDSGKPVCSCQDPPCAELLHCA